MADSLQNKYLPKPPAPRHRRRGRRGVVGVYTAHEFGVYTDSKIQFHHFGFFCLIA